MMPVDYAGEFSSHSVHHKKTWTLAETIDKKLKDKEKRKAAVLVKVAELAAAAVAFNAQPENAPNPFAAARIAGVVGDAAAEISAAVVGGGGGGAAGAPAETGDVVFAAMYGAEDSLAVAHNRGDADFLYTAVVADGEDPQEEGEVFYEAAEETGCVPGTEAGRAEEGS
jgi:hypothetical protein